MTISIDSNVLSTVWSPTDPVRHQVAAALDEYREQASLVICGFVYSELLPVQRSQRVLDAILRELDVDVEWEMDERVFRAAGAAFAGYVERRKTRSSDEPRRLLTDFLIGAHAEVQGHAILTRDKRIFRAAFPKLELLRV